MAYGTTSSLPRFCQLLNVHPPLFSGPLPAPGLGVLLFGTSYAVCSPSKLRWNENKPVG